MPSADFTGYVAAAEMAIAKVNATGGRPLEAEVIADRAPFEMAPSSRRCPTLADGRPAKAALLIHSLGGTPYEMRDLARSLVQACYLVRAILLPGHGTVPGDLLEVDYRQWIEATRSGLASLDGVAEDVVLVGFGIGGTVAIHQALSGLPSPGLKLAALVLLSPALATEPSAWLPAAPLYGAVSAEGRWSRLLADSDPVRYESLPHNALLQRADLIDQVRAQGAPVSLPVFLAASADGAAADAAAARAWFCRSLSGPRRLIWYTIEPAPSTDCPFVIERSSAASPDVVAFSDVALPISPANPRYGADAAYLDCSHYYWEKDTPSWFICMDPGNTPATSQVRYGAISEANLQRHVMRRLTYNPDFEPMVEDMLAFLVDPN